MRILYVVHQFYPAFVSGTEQYVLGLAREGRRHGDDVRVFTLDPRPGMEPAGRIEAYAFQGVPVTLFRPDPAQAPCPALADYCHPQVGAPFRGLLADFRPDLIHFFHFRLLGIERLDDAAAARVPAVINLMDFWFLCPNFLLLKPGGECCSGPPAGGAGCAECIRPEGAGPEERKALLERGARLSAALGGAAALFCPSRTVRGLFDAAGLSHPRLLLEPYAVDWELLARVPPPPAGPKTFGFLGTIAHHKGVDLLIEAFRGLPGEARLRIHGRMGDNPGFDGWLRELAAGDPRISFEGGFERERLAEVLGGLHALVVPSRWRENTPFVCLEGRAAGLPIVASDLPGMAEAIPPGRGRLFRAGDADDLRRALAEEQGRRLGPDRSIPGMPEHYRDFRARYREFAGGFARRLWTRLRRWPRGRSTG